MGFSDWLALASAVIAGIALGVSIASMLFSKRQADAAVEANRISAAELEVSKQQLALARESALPYVAPWRLSWVKGDTYALTNGGSDVEMDVHIEPPEHSFAMSDMDFDEIEPMSSATFMVAITSECQNREATVHWRHGDDAAPLSWTGLLPSRG